MAGVIEVNDASFAKEVLESDLPVMIDMWGDWCEPCKALDPVIEQIARDYDGRLKVCRVDVGSNPRTANACHVGTLPTLLFVRDGEIVGHHIGPAASEVLATKIADHLQLSLR